MITLDKPNKVSPNKHIAKGVFRIEEVDAEGKATIVREQENIFTDLTKIFKESRSQGNAYPYNLIPFGLTVGNSNQPEKADNSYRPMETVLAGCRFGAVADSSIAPTEGTFSYDNASTKVLDDGSIETKFVCDFGLDVGNGEINKLAVLAGTMYPAGRYLTNHTTYDRRVYWQERFHVSPVNGLWLDPNPYKYSVLGDDLGDSWDSARTGQSDHGHINNVRQACSTNGDFYARGELVIPANPDGYRVAIQKISKHGGMLSVGINPEVVTPSKILTLPTAVTRKAEPNTLDKMTRALPAERISSSTMDVNGDYYYLLASSTEAKIYKYVVNGSTGDYESSVFATLSNDGSDFEIRRVAMTCKDGKLQIMRYVGTGTWRKINLDETGAITSNVVINTISYGYMIATTAVIDSFVQDGTDFIVLKPTYKAEYEGTIWTASDMKIIGITEGHVWLAGCITDDVSVDSLVSTTPIVLTDENSIYYWGTTPQDKWEINYPYEGLNSDSLLHKVGRFDWSPSRNAMLGLCKTGRVMPEMPFTNYGNGMPLAETVIAPYTKTDELAIRVSYTITMTEDFATCSA